MQVTSNIEPLDGTRHIVSVAVPSDELKVAEKDFFAPIRKDAVIKGFRKGTAPLDLVIAQAKTNQQLQQRLNMHYVGKYYNQAMIDNDAKALTQPDFKEVDRENGIIGDFNDDGLKFSFEIDLMPELKLTGYKDMELSEPKFNQEDEYARLIEEVRYLFAEREPVEDRELRSGDDAVIDFCGYVDGEEFPGGKAEGEHLNIGSKKFIAGFEEQLIGMNIHEEREITVTFPDNYGNQDLAGKEAKFVVNLNGINEVTLAEIDDELASQYESESKDDFISKKEDEAKRVAEAKNRQVHEQEIVDNLVALHDFPIPVSLVAAREEQIARQLNKDITNEEHKKEVNKIVIDSIKNEIIFEAIFEEEKMEVNNNDIRHALMSEAIQQRVDPNKYIDHMIKNNQIPRFQALAKYRKVFNFILDNSNLNNVINDDDNKEVK